MDAPARCSASLTAFITAGSAPIVPASPTPLTPNGLRGVSETLWPRVEIAEIVGARHAVILERAGEELARVRLVHHLLDERLADPLRDAALDLALAQERVQHAADIVHRGIAHERRLAGVGVDLDLGRCARRWGMSRRWAARNPRARKSPPPSRAAGRTIERATRDLGEPTERSVPAMAKAPCSKTTSLAAASIMCAAILRPLAR